MTAACCEPVLGLADYGEAFLDRPKVLIVEDEPSVVGAMRRRLARYDVEIIEGFHGFQGIWLGLTRQPDVVITDIRMPHASGLEVIECIRKNEHTSDAVVFVLTGSQEPGLERKARERGVSEYFEKPTDLDYVIEKLQDYIDLEHREPGSLSADLS